MAEAISELAGGDGGEEIQGFVVPAGAKISAVSLLTGLYVDTLDIAYQGEGGAEVRLGPVGGFGGISHVFELGEGEYLTGISGRNGVYIDSIRFHTNLRTSDTFGGPFGAAELCAPRPGGQPDCGIRGPRRLVYRCARHRHAAAARCAQGTRTRAAKAEKVVTAEKAPKAAKQRSLRQRRPWRSRKPRRPRKPQDARRRRRPRPSRKLRRRRKPRGRKKAETARVTVGGSPEGKKAPGRKKAEAAARRSEEAPKAKKAPGRKKAAPRSRGPNRGCDCCPDRGSD